MDQASSWHERPGPTIAVGLLLLGVCVVCAWAWIASDLAIARPAGLLSGGAGIYLLVGGVISWRDDKGELP